MRKKASVVSLICILKSNWHQLWRCTRMLDVLLWWRNDELFFFHVFIINSYRRWPVLKKSSSVSTLRDELWAPLFDENSCIRTELTRYSDRCDDNERRHSRTVVRPSFPLSSILLHSRKSHHVDNDSATNEPLLDDNNQTVKTNFPKSFAQTKDTSSRVFSIENLD